MRNLFLLVTLLSLALTGCFFKRHHANSQESRTYAPFTNGSGGGTNLMFALEGGLHGTVSSANQNLKFVVLTFPIGQMAQPGQHLYVYRRGLRVGEISVTGPQRDDNTVADVIAGEAAKGDEVREK